jgi:hypothetical protein
MFSRSRELSVVTKPVIDQIAQSLMNSGYKALISDDRSHVDSATSGFNFEVWHNEECNWIQFTMGIANTQIHYQIADANKFNDNYRCGKVYVAADNSGVWLKLDLIYVRNTDITEILREYIASWDNLVGIFARSLSEVQARRQAEQTKSPPEPRTLSFQGEIPL